MDCKWVIYFLLVCRNFVVSVRDDYVDVLVGLNLCWNGLKLKGFEWFLHYLSCGLRVWFWGVSSYYKWEFWLFSIFCWIYGSLKVIEVGVWWEFGLLECVIFVGFMGFYRSRYRMHFGVFDDELMVWWWEIRIQFLVVMSMWNWYTLLTKRTFVLKCKLCPVRALKQ